MANNSTGNWLFVSMNNKIRIAEYKCSNCRQVQKFSVGDGLPTICPKCKARMLKVGVDRRV